MCRQYYHLKDEEFTESELQAMWFNHIYEEQLTLGIIKDQQSRFDSIMAGENTSTVLPIKEVS